MASPHSPHIEEFVEYSEHGEIQTKVGYPDDRCSPTVLAVITHPYGPLGGDFDNPVCCAVAEACVGAGMLAVRMNFRGVGDSSGSCSWRGAGEQDDVREVVAHYIQSRAFKAPPKVFLVGYSFGSMISGSLLKEYETDLLGYVAVAYPFSVVWLLTLFRTAELQAPLLASGVPKLFLHGVHDNFSSPATAEGCVKGMRNASLLIMEGANHYFGSKKRVKVWD